MSRYRIVLFLILGIGLILPAGCSKKGKGKAVPAEGTIFLENTPLVGATIKLYPKAEGGREANAFSEAEGKFKFTTQNTGDGAEPGEYKVVVTKGAGIGGGDPGDISRDPEKMRKMMEEMYKKQGNRGAPPAVPTSEVHLNYSDPNKTPLTITIPPDGNKELRITIRKNGGI